MRKTKTGIEGLDEMLGGGIIEKRPYLVSGGPGAGKSIFGMQFLIEGAKHGERGLFVTLEEPSSEIIENMKEFGWEFSNIEILELLSKSGNGTWFVPKSFADSELNILSIMDEIHTRVKEKKIKRIVIDSITSLRSLFKTEFEIRKVMLSFMQFLADTGCTTLMLAESHKSTEVESFLARGVFILHVMKDKGSKKRAIEIEKLRGTDFDEQLRPMKITKKGIVVYPMDALFK
ncbi:MAG: RAD55 family ATPase [Candidatus Methanofastidiosia archaeon]